MKVFRDEEAFYKKLGKIFNDMLTPEDKGIMSIGLIPSDAYDTFLDEMLKETCRRLGQSQKYAHMSIEEIRAGLDKSFLFDVEDKLSKAIYATAKMVV